MNDRYDTDIDRRRRERPRDEQNRFESESDRGWGRSSERNRYEPENRYSSGLGDTQYGETRDNGRFDRRYSDTGYEGRLYYQDRYAREGGGREDQSNDWNNADRFNTGWPQGGRGGSRRYMPEYERPQYSLAGGRNESYYQAGGASTGGSSQPESLFSNSSLYPSSSWNGPNAGRQDQQSGSRGNFAGRGPKGYRRSDERILEDVNEALSAHSEIDASEIEVKVNNGEVTLSGTVNERRFKRMAEDIAERCSGVMDVRNEIRIERESQSNKESESNSDTQSHHKSKPTASAGGRSQESKTA